MIIVKAGGFLAFFVSFFCLKYNENIKFDLWIKSRLCISKTIALNINRALKDCTLCKGANTLRCKIYKYYFHVKRIYKSFVEYIFCIVEMENIIRRQKHA